MAFKRPERPPSASLPARARLGGSRGVYHVPVGREAVLDVTWLSASEESVPAETKLSVRGPGSVRQDVEVEASGDGFRGRFTPDRPGQWWYLFETATSSARGVIVAEPR